MKHDYRDGLMSLLKDWKSCVLLVAALYFFISGNIILALLCMVAEMGLAD